MWIVARRASSEFSRGVERSETPRNRCKVRCFRRNHLGARLMIPCRETIGGDPAVRGYRGAQPPAKFGFFPAGKELSEDSCQFSVFRFQMSARSGRGAWKGNVTNFGAGAINPRKGDSSCYPRVMPEAYPWLKLISPWFNPGMGCIAA